MGGDLQQGQRRWDGQGKPTVTSHVEGAGEKGESSFGGWRHVLLQYCHMGECRVEADLVQGDGDPESAVVTAIKPLERHLRIYVVQPWAGNH